MRYKYRQVASVLTNRQDFKSFFEKYFEPVFQFTRKYTGDEAIAHDITQDAFIKLYVKRENFDVIEKAKSFVYITARNLCLDHLKHLKIEHEYARSFPLDEAEEQQFFFEEITYQETLRILYEAIDKLPPQTREIILVGLDGKDNNEIAATLNVSVNTVKTLKKNAYKVLRESLNSYKAWLLLTILTSERDI